MEQVHSNPFASPLQLANTMLSNKVWVVHNGQLRELYSWFR